MAHCQRLFDIGWCAICQNVYHTRDSELKKNSNISPSCFKADSGGFVLWRNMFPFRSPVAFLFNWIGFFLSFCLTTSAAGRYGAISGFGLSLIKWVLIVRVRALKWTLSTRTRWECWVFSGVHTQCFDFFMSYSLPSLTVFHLLPWLFWWAVLVVVGVPGSG